MVNYKEFSKRMQDERVIAYFAIMGLDSCDVWDLFRLLDTDQSAELDLDEFVSGFMRLRGQAKSIDLARLSYENKQMRARLATFMDWMERNMTEVLKRVPPKQPGQVRQIDTCGADKQY